jgi:hypothetical protein
MIRLGPRPTLGVLDRSVNETLTSAIAASEAQSLWMASRGEDLAGYIRTYGTGCAEQILAADTYHLHMLDARVMGLLARRG